MKGREIPGKCAWRLYALAAFGMLCALALGYWVGYGQAAGRYENLFAQVAPIYASSTSDALIAPLLAYRTPEATLLGVDTGLQTALTSEVTSATNSGEASRISIYFRDLNTSAWVGINEDDQYYPASLLKVPVMIAYYKEAESDPSLLSQPIVYQDLIPPDPFEATSTLVIGKSYTVEELIDQMITNSDNGATFELLNNIDPNVLDEVYADLGVQNPGSNSSTYQIPTRTYALFFRILYNATYLDPEYSEKALQLLSQATFTQGLVAGVPARTTIAHKYGEHVDANDSDVTSIELSDCGIVYYPSHPYLLCVMTQAPTVADATSVIAQMSATTYADVANKYGAAN